MISINSQMAIPYRWSERLGCKVVSCLKLFPGFVYQVYLGSVKYGRNMPQNINLQITLRKGAAEINAKSLIAIPSTWQEMVQLLQMQIFTFMLLLQILFFVVPFVPSLFLSVVQGLLVYRFRIVSWWCSPQGVG